MKRFFFALLALFALVSTSQAAITLNGTQSSGVVSAGTSTTLTTIVVASGSNTVLMVGLVLQVGTSSPSCNWDNAVSPQAMFLIGNASGTGEQVTLFGLRNPHVGTLTLACSWTAAGSGSIGGQAFDGVDTSSDANAFKNQAANNGSSTTAFVAIVNVTGGMVVDVAGQAVQNFSNPGTAQSTIFINNSSPSVAIAMGNQSGAGTLTSAWTIGISGPWADQGVSLAPLPAAGGVTRTLMGVGQ